MTTVHKKITAILMSLVVVVPLAFVSVTAGADPWPLDVTISQGRIGANFDIPSFTPMGRAVSNPANFGTDGVVPADTTVKAQATADTGVTAAYLSDVDVYFDGWMTNGDWLAGEIDAIVTWVNAGGVLIITDDTPAANELGAAFGAGVPNFRNVGEAGNGTAVIIPDTSTAPGAEIAAGPFGAWTQATILGTAGWFDSVPSGWTQMAVDENDNPVMLTTASGSGHVILVTDEGLFRNDDLTGACNVMSYAVSLTWDSGDPQATPNPSAECIDDAPPPVDPTPTPTPGGPTPTPTPDPTPGPTPEPTPEPTVVRCNGQVATIVGTSASETINGTAGPDVIHALGGNDIVNGGGGSDIICGGLGFDTLNGGADKDWLFGNKGNDTMNGGIGPDVLNGGNGRDTLLGAKGNDDLFGGKGNDDLRGGFGRDDIRAGGGNDTAKGGPGNDDILGGPGDDSIDGGPGADTCAGGPGTDTSVRCEVWSPF